MEALAWHFLISSVLSVLPKHSCQVHQPNSRQVANTAPPLRPIILLPAPSGSISYEALQYPVPMEPYQLVPLVINTGKIPLINHAVQAPIQYFVPNTENQQQQQQQQQRVASNSVKYSTVQQNDEHGPQKPSYTNAVRTENHRPKYKYYPTAMTYSETHVEGQPASRYSYGYKIIDGNIMSNNRQQHETSDNGGLARPDKSKRVSEHATPADRSPNAADKLLGKQQDGSKTSLQPIVVQVSSDKKTRKTELKKRYKHAGNATKSVTPINAADENGILTTQRP